jgi:hypothetical protein
MAFVILKLIQDLSKFVHTGKQRNDDFNPNSERV